MFSKTPGPAMSKTILVLLNSHIMMYDRKIQNRELQEIFALKPLFLENTCFTCNNGVEQQHYGDIKNIHPPSVLSAVFSFMNSSESNSQKQILL